jgi:hypothetical protein
LNRIRARLGDDPDLDHGPGAIIDRMGLTRT